MEKIVLIRYGEIYLKGKNRKYFEKTLENNIKIARLVINKNVSGDFHKKLFSMPSLHKVIDANFQGLCPPVKNYLISFVTTGYYQMIKDWVNKDVREPISEIVQLILSLYDIISSSHTAEQIGIKN